MANGSEDLSRIFPGESQMARRMRALDWSTTDLGEPATWPESLRTAVSICLTSRFPIVLWWGPALTLLYNDAYVPLIGPSKHPRWLGRSGRDCWREIWDTIGPMLEGVLRDGRATWSEELLLPLDRHLPGEECYFTFSYSPILTGDGARVGGIFCAVTETTDYVLGRRRLETLRELGRRTAQAETAEAACRRAIEALAENPRDVPFAALYLVDAERREARLGAATGAGGPFAAAVALDALATDPSASGGPPALPAAIARVWRTRRPRDVALDAPGPEAPRTALVLPVVAPGIEGHGAVLVAGANPRRPLDATHREFFASIAGSVGIAVAESFAYEAARRRLALLAELDRAKTAFFSNVSHEFRTPLTLMLGPLAEALAGDLPAPLRTTLALAHRNGLRLHRLVNTLLDFARIEAGRTDAVYEPVDVAAFTAEVASSFRSAMEHAGLAFEVRCPPVAAPVYVDRDMWEKIVLNLLSNAFKFTLAGSVIVSVAERDGAVELAVADTGVGIPASELPRVFERFHRVRGTEGRTHEGTGIGLALVGELVKLHGGAVRATSEPGRGSTFTVRIPTGSAHLPPDRLGAARTRASTAIGAAPFVEEALRWLPETASPAAPEEREDAAVTTRGARVLVADDNADMRAYFRRLLAPYWEVEAVADGEAALAAVRRERADLVLSDVMMPRLDGIGLTRALRADPTLGTTPVILVSARAGEESRLAGAEARADDYLTKPFSARELVARVNLHLELARARCEAEARLRASEARLRASEEAARRAQAEAETANRAKDDFLAMVSHELRSPLQGILGWLALLKQGRLDREQTARALDSLERSVHLQAQLVHDILDVSRIVAGKVELAREPVDLAVLLATTAEELAPSAAAKGLALTVDATPCGEVLGDRERLHQVFSNLLTNAVKFTPAGGRVTLTCRREDGELVIAVADTGEGIAPAFLPRLFERFSQADVSTTRRHGGLGLGLAIVRHLVELHGGRVAAASPGVGGGATFSVRLPLADEAGARRRKAPRPVPRLDGVDVLLVDDDPSTLEAMTIALRAQGARVRATASAGEAWAAIVRAVPDVVVSDLAMPDEDGYALLRRIRRIAPALPALALTASTRPEDEVRVRAAGFAAHVAKPAEPARLVRTVARVFAAARAAGPAVHVRDAT